MPERPRGPRIKPESYAVTIDGELVATTATLAEAMRVVTNLFPIPASTTIAIERSDRMRWTYRPTDAPKTKAPRARGDDASMEAAR